MIVSKRIIKYLKTKMDLLEGGTVKNYKRFNPTMTNPTMTNSIMPNSIMPNSTTKKTTKKKTTKKKTKVNNLNKNKNKNIPVINQKPSNKPPITEKYESLTDFVNMIKTYNKTMKIDEDVKDDDMTDDDMEKNYEAYLKKIKEETDETNLEKISYNKYLKDVEESERFKKLKELGNTTNV